MLRYVLTPSVPKCWLFLVLSYVIFSLTWTKFIEKCIAICTSLFSGPFALLPCFQRLCVSKSNRARNSPSPDGDRALQLHDGVARDNVRRHAARGGRLRRALGHRASRDLRVVWGEELRGAIQLPHGREPGRLAGVLGGHRCWRRVGEW
jgi:hypothetical protein